MQLAVAVAVEMEIPQQEEMVVLAEEHATILVQLLEQEQQDKVLLEEQHRGKAIITELLAVAVAVELAEMEHQEAQEQVVLDQFLTLLGFRQLHRA